MRLRGNALWPAMHPGTRAFNFYPENKDLADQYGVVMGSSHCEQMLRNNVDEWKRDGSGEYNFATNREGVLRYWEDRIRQNGRYESLYTLGMRGIHDSGMPGGGTLEEQTERLERIMRDQRDLLAKWVNPDVRLVPQIFCPYKEVLELYRRARNIPEDVTVVWPDDNYGYVRQFSDSTERKRSGGAGVYYHISYWGRPYDYIWLHSTHPALVREEMSKAWNTGARTFWVFNVGDIKPAEIGIECALRLAWNPKDKEDGVEAILTRDFGSGVAKEALPLLRETYRLHFQRRPEHMGYDANNPFLSKPAFSTCANGDESQKRLDAFRSLELSLDRIEKKLKPEQRDAFFEMIGYPVRSAALMNEKGIFIARYFTHVNQRRACAAACLEQARSAEQAIHELTKTYNERIAQGKWRHMMSDQPRDLAVFRMPDLRPPEVEDTDGWGLALEGNEKPVFASEQQDGQTDAHAALPQFHVLSRRRYFVDVFGTGMWKATVRMLPTWSLQADSAQRYAIALDDEAPVVAYRPAYAGEKDPQWQEDVLRNAALTVSTHDIRSAGRHTLKIWTCGPGIVIDRITADGGCKLETGYVGPEETRFTGDAKNH
jgi:hypothetical protein